MNLEFEDDVIDKVLTDLGLTKYEAMIYRALIKLGEAKALEIAQTSGVPREKTYQVLRELEDKYRLPMTLAAHVLEGCVHPTIWVNTKDEEEMERARKFFDEIIRVALELDGTVSAEHGIGILKKKEFVLEFEKLGSTKPLELMREIKKIFDPKNILNPGKIFE